MEKNIRTRKVLIMAFIILVSCGIRTVYLANNNVPIRADAKDYLNIAYNLVNHHTFSKTISQGITPLPDKSRSPGYPFYLSLFFKLSPDFRTLRTAVFASQAFLDTITVLATYLLAVQFLPFWAAAAAAAMAGLSPNLVVMTGYFLTETLFTFLLICGVLFFTWAVKRKKGGLFLLSGFFLGCAVMVRTALLLFPFVLLLPLFFILKEKGARKWKWTAVFLTGSFLLTSLWIVRNLSIEAVSEKQHSIALNSFVHGSYPNFIYQSPHLYGYPYREDPKAEYMYKSFGNTMEVLRERFSRNPWRYLRWYLGGKVLALWQWDNRAGGTGDIYIYPFIKSGYLEVPALEFTRVLMKVLHPFLLLWGAAGVVFFLVKKKWREVKDLGLTHSVLLLVYFMVIHSILASFPRYSIPLRPYLYVVAVFALHASITYLSGRYATLKNKPKNS